MKAYTKIYQTDWEDRHENKDKKSLYVEIYKTLNNLNPKIMKNVRLPVTNIVQREWCKFYGESQKLNQVRFGTWSLCIQGLKVWNSLPYFISVAEKCENFKRYKVLGWKDLQF